MGRKVGLNSSLKALLTVTGALTGYTVVRFLLSDASFFDSWMNIVVSVAAGLLLAVISFFSACEIIKGFDKLYERAEKLVMSLTLSEIGVCSVGIIVGLAVSYFVTAPFATIRWVGLPLTICINVFLAYMGFTIAFWKRSELSGSTRANGSNVSNFSNGFNISNGINGSNGAIGNRGAGGIGNSPKLLDTSVIIDGRIAGMLRTGFIEGELIVPEFVLEELRCIADSSDSIKRKKGRRGLDILNYIQKELGFCLTIEKCELPVGVTVDKGLLNLAKQNHYDILTTDYNLNKVASFQGIRVLNINELNNAIKPLAMPGEIINLFIVKEGKEPGQGIGYMPDGMMIVVEGGKPYIGMTISISLQSIIQSNAGRMMFAKAEVKNLQNNHVAVGV
jgi:uncharacterized protein YacL